MALYIIDSEIDAGRYVPELPSHRAGKALMEAEADAYLDRARPPRNPLWTALACIYGAVCVLLIIGISVGLLFWLSGLMS